MSLMFIAVIPDKRLGGDHIFKLGGS